MSAIRHNVSPMKCFSIPAILLPRTQDGTHQPGSCPGVAVFGQQQSNMAAVSTWSQNGDLTQVKFCTAYDYTLAGSGRWDWFMGARDTGWIGAMGLIHGGTPWRRATLAGPGWWDWFMGVRHGSAQHWLERGDGINLWGRRRIMRVRSWVGVMGLIYRGPPWGARAWSGRYNWFLRACHGGARHWLDMGDGIDLWGCAMGVRDTSWMGLIHGGMLNDKVQYSCWI